MLETNIRIVRPGTGLFLWTRRAAVRGPNVTVALLERACGALRHRHGLAAIVDPHASASLWIATNRVIPSIHLEGDDWELDVADAGEDARRLDVAEPDGQATVPALIERMLQVTLARRTEFWTLDSSRVWYARTPFRVEGGIAAYRRYELASLWIAGVGVGVAVDIRTAFFSEDTLADYFDPNAALQEQRARQQRFAQLTDRQAGQKGTLLYDNGRTRVKCYFEQAPTGMTCATTEKIRVKGKTYDSLHAYYRDQFSDLGIAEDAPVVRVSFPNLGWPRPIAAELVRVRVMKDAVPEVLSAVDKIPPHERRDLIDGFWSHVGQAPFGPSALGLQEGFWRPDSDRVERLLLPALMFGHREALPSPAERSTGAYRAHFRRRGALLADAGCYAVPPTMPRTLHLAYPSNIEPAACRQFAVGMTEIISSWSGHTVEMNFVAYATIDDAFQQLSAAEQAGAAVFILDQDPTAYHEVAYRLSDWRIKRITRDVLCQHIRYLQGGAWDRRSRSYSMPLGRRRWESFLTLCALDVLQLLDVVPFRVERAGSYEGQLVIDVGHDRRYFALSLLIARDEKRTPAFRIVSDTHHKPDHKHEQVNAVMLEDGIVALVEKALGRRGEPLESLLVLRDGQYCGEETRAVDQALERLSTKRRLTPNARVELAELRKDSLKSLRLWEVDQHGTVDNPLEGTVVRLNNKVVLVTPTGAATLHQGTADPLLLTANGRCAVITDAAEAVFAGAQLNWSSPAVAQRLSLPFKRTDEELTARAAQEIKRLR